MQGRSDHNRQTEAAAGTARGPKDPGSGVEPEELSGLRATIVMRGHLLANVAHEIRTPLSAIRGYARMLVDGRAGPVNPRQSEFLNAINENTNKLIHLVNWMTRIGDPARQILRLSVLDGRALWTECLAARKDALSEKAIHIEETFSGESFPIVGDQNKLAAMLTLVLDTAILHSRSGAQLSMTMSTPREGGLGLKLSGIAGTMADAVEVSNTTDAGEVPDSADAKSLAQICDIVGLHGGRLFIRRTSEEGSIILFTLPDVRTELVDEWTDKRPA